MATADRLKCSVCVDIFSEDNPLMDAGSCGHLFHRECLGTWRAMNNPDCPNCRRVISVLRMFPDYTMGEPEPVRTMRIPDDVIAENRELRRQAAGLQSDLDQKSHEHEELKTEYDFTVQASMRAQDGYRREIRHLQQEVVFLQNQRETEMERTRLRLEAIRFEQAEQLVDHERSVDQLTRRNTSLQDEILRLKATYGARPNLELELYDARRLNGDFVRQHEAARSVYASNIGRRHNPTRSDRMLSLRNISEEDAKDPADFITRLFNQLAIPHEPNDYHIVACEPMVVTPHLYIVSLECMELGVKFDLLTKLQHLQKSSDKAWRQLQLKDSYEVNGLYKLVRARLVDKCNIRTLKVRYDQIIVHISGEENPREVEDEAQLEIVAELLPTSPSVLAERT